MNIRPIIFGLILAICVGAILFITYLSLEKADNEINNGTNSSDIDNTTDLRNFENLFHNAVDMQGYNISGISKIDISKALVYTSNEIVQTKDKEYNLNVNIPTININNNIIQEYNEEIKSIFEAKATSILNETNSYTIYSVEYQAYVNSNILSLVIKSTLKVGNSAQRVIVKTYNYNLSTNETVGSSEIIGIKGLTIRSVNEKIRTFVAEAAKETNKLAELGYNVYIRNLDSDIYNIENTTEFFLGENGTLYILYPYGNSNYTSEIDIITF